ncbi:MAG: hypothetical protein QHI48_06310 [Bacteroidota bacterium]|nr:hypothetical protein [Bacteroidota bacterium]
MKLHRNPGVFLLLMSSWVVPFFIIEAFSHPFRGNLPSFTPFFIWFSTFSVAALLFSMFDSRKGFWHRYGFWKRYTVLEAAYAGTTLVALLLHTVLDSLGMVDYFGGDPEGSFAMYYIPSIMVYAAAGALLYFIRRAFGTVR